MPEQSQEISPTSLTYEQKQELTRDDWVKVEQKYRRRVHRFLRDPKTPARELNDLVRSAAIAYDKAYPDAGSTGISTYVPAKLLKPIEQAILGVSKKHHRESFSIASESSVKTSKVKQTKMDKLP